MKRATNPTGLSQAQSDKLLESLQLRFENNRSRHSEISWVEVRTRIAAHPEKLKALQAMENTGGQPDVVGRDAQTGEILFFDCSPQSPEARASLCYDQEALDSRKKLKPKGSALGLAADMGAEMLTEEQYGELQKRGEFDTKSSSWLRTPEDVRSRGGALFGDRRFGRVFVYHNGAESYYAGRGFRCCLKV